MPPAATATAVAFPVLPVADLARAMAWYGRLGFATVAEYDDYAILSFSGAEVHLAAHDSAPTPEASLSGAYLRVADADAVHAGWTAVGTRIVKEPIDQPYGIREFAIEDLDGNLWRVGSLLQSPEAESESEPSRGIDDSAVDSASVGAADPSRADAPAPTDGSAGTGDDSWASVAAGDVPCAGCALKASDGPATAVRAEILFEADRWARVIGAAGDDAMRIRPDDQTWSALEYAFHVKGVLGVMTERIALMLVETAPDLGWWDQDAAIDDGMANELDSALVVDDLQRNAQNLADVLAQVDGSAWERSATRRGESFSVESIARYAWHEAVHHRVDAEEVLAAVSR
ncbi:MAG: VOC family protein [Aquihabitans sp.]